MSAEERQLLEQAAEIASGIAMEDRALTRDELLALFRRLEPLGYLHSTLAPGRIGPIGFAALVEGLSPNLPLLGNHSVQRYIDCFGTAAQKARFLPPLFEGQSIAGIAITEPQAGADFRQFATRAVRRGGDFVLDGMKTWIGHGMVADLFVVVAQTDEGLTRFLLPGDTPGLVRRPLDTLGLRHLTFAELTFEGCVVPADLTLGPPGAGSAGTRSAFPIARALVGLQAVRIGESALSLAAAFARDRVLFARRLGESALVQDRVAELEARLAGARLLAYAVMQNLDDPDASARASSMKAAGCQAALDATDWAADLLGSTGLLAPSPLERLRRDARMLAVVDGTVALNRFVAARPLTAPR